MGRNSGEVNGEFGVDVLGWLRVKERKEKDGASASRWREEEGRDKGVRERATLPNPHRCASEDRTLARCGSTNTEPPLGRLLRQVGSWQPTA